LSNHTKFFKVGGATKSDCKFVTLSDHSKFPTSEDCQPAKNESESDNFAPSNQDLLGRRCRVEIQHHCHTVHGTVGCCRGKKKLKLKKLLHDIVLGMSIAGLVGVGFRDFRMHGGAMIFAISLAAEVTTFFLSLSGRKFIVQVSQPWIYHLAPVLTGTLVLLLLFGLLLCLHIAGKKAKIDRDA